MMVKFIFMTATKISKAVQNHVMKVSNLLKFSDENNLWNIQNYEKLLFRIIVDKSNLILKSQYLLVYL